MLTAIFTVITWASPAVAQQSVESKYARSLLRRIGPSEVAPIVILTADGGASCRKLIDQIGLWAARERPVLPVEGDDPEELADFLENSRVKPTRFGRFAAKPGLVLIHKPTDFTAQDLVARRVAARILDGGDRAGWGFTPTDHVAFIFETRVTAPFLDRRSVGATLELAEATTRVNQCRSSVFKRETLVEGRGSCPRALSTVRSGWSRQDQ